MGAKYSGQEAWRRWRALDVSGIVKAEEWASGTTSRMVAAQGERVVARYTRCESLAPYSNSEIVVTHELDVTCAVMAAALDALAAREDAAEAARRDIAALAADPEWADWRREVAHEAGAAHGPAGFNEVMGY